MNFISNTVKISDHNTDVKCVCSFQSWRQGEPLELITYSVVFRHHKHILKSCTDCYIWVNRIWWQCTAFT